MSAIHTSIEAASPELLQAYVTSTMERGLQGERAIKWAFGSDKNCFSIARLNGEIVGISSYIANRFTYGSETGTAFQAVDSFVSERVRGRGVFTQLAKSFDDYVSSMHGSLVWGFPNDNAAPIWFNRLSWDAHGQVPFLIKPLRAGYFLRKVGLHGDFSITTAKNQRLQAVDGIGDWADELWSKFAENIKCAAIRDRTFLRHRISDAPHAEKYRVVADIDGENSSLVVCREEVKHGGQIGYIMEAMGKRNLSGLLVSELARMRDNGTELALAWCFPWSPNYNAYRKAGFVPLPRKLRPINIWFGGRSHSHISKNSCTKRNWYLSYLDSDTV